jgi:hypothetical protein
VKEAGFKCLHTQNRNQDPLENTFGAIRSYCVSNSNPTLRQSVDALKTNIISGLAFRGLCETNCNDDGGTFLDNLQSLLTAPNASSPNPSGNHGKEAPYDVPERFHVAHQVQKDIGTGVHIDDMEVFSVAFVGGSIARQVLHGVNCGACKMCLSDFSSTAINQCLHIFQGVIQNSFSFALLRTWWRLLVRVYDGRIGQLELSGMAYHSCH